MSAFADFTTICMYLFLPLQFWDEFFGFLKSMRGPPFPSRPHPKPWLAVISPLSPPTTCGGNRCVVGGWCGFTCLWLALGEKLDRQRSFRIARKFAQLVPAFHYSAILLSFNVMARKKRKSPPMWVFHMYKKMTITMRQESRWKSKTTFAFFVPINLPA